MKSLILIFALFVSATAVLAETDDVQVRQVGLTREYSRNGMHFEALAPLVNADPSTLTLEEQLAAAKGSWALGLPEMARKFWSGAFSRSEFKGPERQRELIARAILELQEANYEEARAIAERAASEIEPSPLRGQLWLVIAESLRLQGILSRAEEYYRKAVEESESDQRSEANYLLGECQLKLGMMKEARYSFSGVDSKHTLASMALRRLLEIDAAQHNHDAVLTWIGEGRAQFPNAFEDPWVSAMAVSAYISTERLEDAKTELGKMKTRYSQDEPWVSIAEAAIESARASGFIATTPKEHTP